MAKSLLVTLLPGTLVLDINSELNSAGEISFSTEPAFVLVYGPNGTSVLGLLDHELPLGVHKRSQVPHAFTLLPPDILPEQIETHVFETYRALFNPELPPPPFPQLAPPLEHEQFDDSDPAPAQSS